MCLKKFLLPSISMSSAMDSYLNTQTPVSYEDIPVSLIGSFLPESSLPVCKFTTFDLPIVSPNAKNAAITIAWSSKSPTSPLAHAFFRNTAIQPSWGSLLQFLALPTPSKNANSIEMSNSHGSIQHDPKLKAVWETVLSLLNIQDLWITTFKWLDAAILRNPSLQADVTAVQQILQTSAWNRSITTPPGTTCPSFSTLSRYLSSSWLCTLDMVMHSHHLQTRQSTPASIHCSKENFLVLLNAFYIASIEDRAHYWPLRHFSPLRILLDQLDNGSLTHVISALNVGGDHWVAYVISGVDHVLFIGDPMHGNSKKKPCILSIHCCRSALG